MSKLTHLSKFMSLILRHQPEEIGLTLDANGWADIELLIKLANDHGTAMTRPLLEEIVATNDKRRFVMSDDGLRIRANQGHSVKIDLNLPPSTPPDQLFHGTATRFEQSIRNQGLLPGSRQHVHLSRDIETATKVGMRHGKPVVLIIDTAGMHREGHVFYLSENGVWLTANVPAKYIKFPD